jgi:hypothetical protein
LRAARPAALYKRGFRNPRVGFPAATSPSFKSAMMDANVGVLQLVPSTVPSSVSGVYGEWS